MEAADAVIMANYPQNGGAAAIADTLLGKLSPAGRLPVTWHKNWNCSIEPDPKNPGRTTGRCAIMPAKLLGTDLTYRYGGSDNTLWPFGYVSATANCIIIDHFSAFEPGLVAPFLYAG